MRTFSAAIAAHLADRRISAIHLLEILGGATPLRWTDAPFPVSYGGNTYVQQWFDVGDLVIDDTGNQACELVFAGVDRIVRGLLLSESWSYRPATLRKAFLNPDRSVIDAFIWASGRADGGLANLNDESEPITMAIVPDNDAEGSPGPAQEYGFSCRYLNTSRFKGIQCGYAGAETTCDGTFARCSALGNQTRFGGFRFAPEPGTKIVVGGGSTEIKTRNAVENAAPGAGRRRSVRS